MGDQQLFPPPGASGSYWICGPGSFGAWRRCQLGFGSGWQLGGVLLVSRQSISLLPLLLLIRRRLCARVCSIRRTHAGRAQPSPLLERVPEERAGFILRLSLGTVVRTSGFLVEMGDTDKGQG